MICGAISAFGLFMTSALWAWFSLLMGMIIWGLLDLGERRQWRQPALNLLLSTSLLLMIGAVFALLLQGSGMPQSGNRLEFMRQTWALVADSSHNRRRSGHFSRAIRAIYPDYAVLFSALQ